MPNILRLYESDADKSRYLICHRDFDTHLLITSSCLQEISAKEASSYRKVRVLILLSRFCLNI